MEIFGSEVAFFLDFYCHVSSNWQPLSIETPKRMRQKVVQDVALMMLVFYLKQAKQWRWHLPFLDDAPVKLPLSRGIPRHVNDDS